MVVQVLPDDVEEVAALVATTVGTSVATEVSVVSTEDCTAFPAFAMIAATLTQEASITTARMPTMIQTPRFDFFLGGCGGG